MYTFNLSRTLKTQLITFLIPQNTYNHFRFKVFITNQSRLKL